MAPVAMPSIVRIAAIWAFIVLCSNRRDTETVYQGSYFHLPSTSFTTTRLRSSTP